MKIILVIIICLYWIKIGIYCLFFYSIKRNMFFEWEKKWIFLLIWGKLILLKEVELIK